jgi:hypothetical protein
VETGAVMYTTHVCQCSDDCAVLCHVITWLGAFCGACCCPIPPGYDAPHAVGPAPMQAENCLLLLPLCVADAV